MALVIHQNRMMGRKRTKTTEVQKITFANIVPLNYRTKINGLFFIFHLALKNEILIKIDFSPNVSTLFEMCRYNYVAMAFYETTWLDKNTKFIN